MDRKLTLPALGAVMLAAAAFGVHLGQSAIDQINPLYFQGAAVHPRDRGADLAEASLAPQTPRFAELYGWAEGEAARNADCVDCEALTARDAHHGGEVQFAVLETGWRAEARPAAHGEAEAQPAAEEPAAVAVQWAEVDRYANYAIEEKPDEPPVEVAALQE